MGFRHSMLQNMPSFSVSPAKMSSSNTGESSRTPPTQHITDFSINRILSEENKKNQNINLKPSTTAATAIPLSVSVPISVPPIKPKPFNAANTSTSSPVGILDLSKSSTINENNISNDILYPFYNSTNYSHFLHPDFIAATKFYAHFFPQMFPVSHLTASNPLSFSKRFFAPYVLNSTSHQHSTGLGNQARKSNTMSNDAVDLQQQNKVSSQVRLDCLSCQKYPAYKPMNSMLDSNPFSSVQSSSYSRSKSSASLVLNSSATISLTAVTNVNLTSSKNFKIAESLSEMSIDKVPSTSLSEEISYKCRICDKVFGCSETLQAHEKTHKSPRYECTDCGKGFSQLRNYKYHLSVHRGTKEFAAECPECGKTFNDKGYLSSHMKIHRNKKEYECPYCPKSFNQRVAFNMHVRIHTGVKPHKCTECGKRFSRKMLLKQHMRTHSGEKPYQCSVCGKSFADRSNMTLHHRLHSGIKPFNCPICPKAFTKKHHLKTHLNYHTGCKPYVCPHLNCNQAFTQSSNMRTHAKKCQYRPLQMSALPLNSPGGQTSASTMTSTLTTATNTLNMNSSKQVNSNSVNLLASHYAPPTSGHIENVTPLSHITTPLSATTLTAGIRMLSAASAAATTTSSSRTIMASKSTSLAFPPTQPLLSTLRPL